MLMVQPLSYHESFWEQVEYLSQVWGGYSTIFTSLQCSDITRTSIILRYMTNLSSQCCVTMVERCPHGSQKTEFQAQSDKQLWSLSRGSNSPYDCFFICKTDIKRIVVHLPHRDCEGQNEITILNKMQGIVFISRSGRNTKITDFLASRKLPECCFIWIFIPRILKSSQTVPGCA